MDQQITKERHFKLYCVSFWSDMLLNGEIKVHSVFLLLLLLCLYVRIVFMGECGADCRAVSMSSLNTTNHLSAQSSQQVPLHIWPLQ